ncbi:hypothetical protein J4402_00500 [Candidatus Pacearchaeota archaeon]|nr:hypothetical protein [Candidatus Pacearchaeota archaeon]
MEKRALSQVIATLLLVSVSLTLAVIIIAWARSDIFSLSPQIDAECSEIYFESEILKIDGTDYLFAVNLGNVNIIGFQINVIETDMIENKESVETELPPGKSREIKLNSVYLEDKEFLVVPIIAAKKIDKEIPLTCPETYGQTIETPHS